MHKKSGPESRETHNGQRYDWFFGNMLRISKCVVCEQGDLRSGTTTVALEQDEMILVFRKVPARVCEICGEEYVDKETTTRLLAAAEEAAKSGVQVGIREYVAA